ncbi:hypothetical protein C8Q79DRAFT_970525 [Trametes meyenii]|nr:hypothetical protein C8Q79DRAFT_970525 [Trametes meyenii]
MSPRQVLLIPILCTMASCVISQDIPPLMCTSAVGRRSRAGFFHVGITHVLRPARGPTCTHHTVRSAVSEPRWRGVAAQGESL